jgi:di/tricarboxylate transporter
MTPQGWLTIAVTILILVCLVRNLAPPDILFVLAASIFVVFGIIKPQEAFAGFSNSGMLTVAALFVVAAALRETGVLDYLGHRVLGSTRSERGVLVRLAALVLPMSAFMNNTPIVAMFIAPVMDWCRNNRVSPSRMLIPLSYLTILGGTCTLIGTSTNLVVNGLLVKSQQEVQKTYDATSDTYLQGGKPVSQSFVDSLRGMGLFEIGKVGLPYAIIGTAYLMLFGRRLLPVRKELMEQLGETQREYLVEMHVEPHCRLVGQDLERAGLRQLPGLFLIEIDRDGRSISPVSPEEVIEAGDRLVFTGVVSSIVDLEKIPGLVPAVDPEYEVTPRAQRRRSLCEAVVSTTSPLVGKSIRSADFRAQYNAAVVAVHRNGERMGNKVGETVLQPGDTLLLQTTPHFARAHRNNADFYLVSHVHEWRPLRRDRAGLALALFAGLLVLMTTGLMETHVAAILAAALMVLCGCISSGDARQSIEWQVLITIAASFAVSTALENSGAAAVIARLVVDSTRIWGPVAALAAVYLMTMVLTEMITNNAAAVLIFPFSLETARLLEVSPRPFVMAIVLAASASFMTPIGYQTNLMVYGPGGYRFTDFVRIGFPLNMLLWGVATMLIPIFWPFY